MATAHNYVPTPMEAMFARVTWDISLVLIAELATVMNCLLVAAMKNKIEIRHKFRSGVNVCPFSPGYKTIANNNMRHGELISYLSVQHTLISFVLYPRC